MLVESWFEVGQLFVFLVNFPPARELAAGGQWGLFVGVLFSHFAVINNR